MTREEAIKILRYNSNVIHKTIHGETDPEEVEALDMAIKALEQESITKNALGVDDNAKKALLAVFEKILKETVVETLTEIQSEIRALPMHYDPQDVADLIQENIDGLKGEDNK